jgi:hypothetical protein
MKVMFDWDSLWNAVLTEDAYEEVVQTKVAIFEKYL